MTTSGYALITRNKNNINWLLQIMLLMSASGTKRTTTLALPCATKCQFASELMHFNLVTSINTEHPPDKTTICAA